MLITFSVAISILLILILSGYPIVQSFFQRDPDLKLDGIIIIALSLIVGFGISSFSAATSYGILGISSFPHVFFGIALISWIFYLTKFRVRVKLSFMKKDLLIFLPILISVYLSSSQWNGLLKPIIKVGEGPDVAQNLLAAKSADKFGSTWLQSLNSLKEILNVDSFNQAVFNLFRVPSTTGVAVYDYLVFGVRWGLTVPYNQVIRIFGESAVMWETGLILLLSLMSFSVFFFGISRLFSKNSLYSVLLPVTVICNSAMLYQYLNGGLSQIFGQIGIAGLIFVATFIIRYKELTFKKPMYFGLIIVCAASWSTSYISYIDSTLIFFILISFYVITTYFSSKKETAKKISTIFFVAGLLSLLLTPAAIYANLVNINFRLKAASGTGLANQIVSYPSNFFGLINTFPPHKISGFTTGVSIIISLLIFFVFTYYLFAHKNKNEFAIFGIISYLIILLGYYFSTISRQKTSYIYDKISVYVAPLVITSLFLLLMQDNRKNINDRKFFGAFFSLASLLSVVNFQNFNFNLNTTTIIPYEIRGLLHDNEAQKYMDLNNYFMPYKPTYSYAAVLGAEYWISKAPNDMILDSRIKNELKLFCFRTDVSCKPTTPKVLNSPLEKYGIAEYMSPVSTSEFYGLTIDQKFKLNFEVFGMPDMVIPEKFKGGNPYYK
jgi:hypothetical protein